MIADADAVAAACATLCSGGIVLGSRGFSVGPYTPAVDDGFAWAVIGLRGQAVFLAYDAFEAARQFLRLEVDAVPEEDLGAWFALPDSYLAAMQSYEDWSYQHQFTPWGDRNYVPPFPSLSAHRERSRGLR